MNGSGLLYVGGLMALGSSMLVVERAWGVMVAWVDALRVLVHRVLLTRCSSAGVKHQRGFMSRGLDGHAGSGHVGFKASRALCPWGFSSSGVLVAGGYARVVKIALGLGLRGLDGHGG